MTPTKKESRRLRNLVLLSLLLLLIGGSYAFTAFNQRAINDRENQIEINVGGRVHDYYNRETENKDVFAENYDDEEPIMLRIRLSEFLETRKRGEDTWTPLVAGTERDNLDSWTTWMPSPTNINDRLNTDPSNAFDRYARLTFGWSRAGRDAPWYMPTFNHENTNQMTAAAGHARDYIAGSGATDGVTDGATHPGDGTDDYWSEGDVYTNDATPPWPGASLTNEAEQNLQQERAPMTIEQWAQLPPRQQIGDFWVVDHQTGWAYWASLLEPKETTSYLLDAAKMTDAIKETVVNGHYYYGIHVESDFIAPSESDDFLPEGDARLADFLTGIRNNAMGGVNPGPDVDAPPSDFAFHVMNPGRIFTMAGEQYRYLENMGNDNHLIIRNNAIRNVSFNNQETHLTSWYAGLHSAVQAMVQPVANSFTTGQVADAAVTFIGGERWKPDNLTGQVAADITQVVPGGTARAFSLSLADVAKLSGEGLGFPNPAQRGSIPLGWWWLRTPGISGNAWFVYTHGLLDAINSGASAHSRGGIRPALIIHQTP
ncbi:DUF6273 domain-containing protein [Lactococcus garvieae]|uniref:DUF6273 domain-containing protein n=1 Tax=Lactococcus garvieae DCC43 TaxID=1231377 RepID=K2PYC8_9LACT|nr:DUF6273 domain-containing protein [Lactococcus garvieae]EKF52446.1 hypothetical protein C426_0019 [Lactococcus garvieae DCC43]